MKFKVGDEVRIIKPKNTGDSPLWLHEMNDMDGKIVTLFAIDVPYWLINGFAYNEDWMELIDAKKVTFDAFDAFDRAMDIV